MKNFLRYAGPLLVLAALAAALWLLSRELRDFHLRDLDEGLRQISPASLVLAVGLTALNFVVLLGYDMLAIHQLRFPVPWRKVALAAFLGDVCAENFGSLLGGSSIRYRLYSAWGLSAVQVMQLVLILSLTFWVGAIALGGAVFVLHPLAVPPQLHLPLANTFPVGVVLLALAALYLLLCAPKHRRLRVLGWTVPLPTLPVALGQIAVTSADILVATGVLYAILPPGLGVSFGQLLGVYLLAMLAGACSHVPGGLGVFELVMVVMLAPEEPHGLVAALLLFRGVYYLLPLLIAAVVLGIHEGMRHRETLGRLASATGQAAPLVVPRLLALVLFAAGTVLLVTGTLPADAPSVGWLNRFVPLALLELSHFTASIVGVLLLLLARAVARRLDSAYWLSLALLAAGALLALVRGVDIVEACLLALAALAMLPCRNYFRRRGSLWRQPLGTDVLAAIGLVLLGAVGLGLFAHKHAGYTGELWWQFELEGDAPRFLRAMAGVAAVLLMAGVVRLLKPERVVRRAPEPDDLQQARRVVADAGSASGNLVLLGDKQLLWNGARDAFVMYGVSGRSWVTMGDPVGPAGARTELAWQFRDLADAYHGWPVFYQAAPENLPIYLDLGLTLLKLGEEGRVPLADFSLEGPARRRLRQTHHRFQRLDCRTRVLPAAEAVSRLDELRAISDAWLAGKHTREKGFSLGRFDEAYVSHFPVAVVEHAGRAIAFANLWSGSEKNELSIDLMRYRPDAPEGVMEYLFIELMLWGRAEGYRWFTLGMAPLSGFADRRDTSLWNRVSRLVYRHGEHFYNFQGLRRYKEKFDPQWEPRYLASPGGMALPRILLDISTLVSGGVGGLVGK